MQAQVSRSDGGLGIRSMGDMNLALVGKLGWRFIIDDDALWAKVLRSKYARASGARNGKAIHFRTDPWLLDKPLLHIAMSAIPEASHGCLVADFWSDNGWNWIQLAELLPKGTLLQRSQRLVRRKVLWMTRVGCTRIRANFPSPALIT